MNRQMHRPITRATVLAIAVVLLALGLSSAALAAGWSDLPADTLKKYGINEAEVAAISQGFTDGTWKADQLVTRAQFTKMAVEAFGVAQANPATPSFTDVPADHQYYQWIEGAKAAGLVNGVTATTFAPDATMTHEQCFAIVMRYVAKTIGIDLGYVYQVPVSTMALMRFADAGAVSPSLTEEVAMAVKYGVYQDEDWGPTLDPQGKVSRIQGAAALVRGMKADGDRLAILGQGAGPVYYPDRNNTGFALFHNGKIYLVDCGMDNPFALANLGFTFDKLAGLFFTHYHIDHTAGYADLLSRGAQANGPQNNLKALEVYGPSLPEAGGVNGLDVLTDGILKAFAPGYELHFWARPYVGAPPTAPAPRPNVTTHPITPNSPDSMAVIPVLTNDPNMRVEAIEVDHDEDFGTCYAYRFTLLDGNAENPQPTGKVVVFSGDRADYNARRDYSPDSPYYAEGGPGFGKPAFFPEHPTTEEFRAAFIDFAKDATILVHEAADSDSAIRIADPNSPVPFVRALYWHLVDSHTDVSEIPQIAKDANAQSVVLHHYGDYTQGNLEGGRSIILSKVLEENAAVGYAGSFIAPRESDVIGF